jgi:hypothetical protein
MQVRYDEHKDRCIELKYNFEREKRGFDEDGKRFFKLFEESTFEGSRAAARKMKKIIKRQTKHTQKILLFQSLYSLIRSDSERLSWPNSPLLVSLQFDDPNLLSGRDNEPLQERQSSETPLHLLADLADPSDCLPHRNQLILAKQLIEHGANVSIVSFRKGKTPLHHACYAGNVTNLDYVEFLLEEGADPNTQDHLGLTPLMFTTTCTPGAPKSSGAPKFVLKWPTTDVNIAQRTGESFLFMVRVVVKYFSDQIAFPDNPAQIRDKFLLQQWIEIEEILVEMGAHDNGIE